MVVAPTRELAVQVGRVANELLSPSSQGSGSSKSPAAVALLIEESGGAGGAASQPPLGSIAAPVVVGTAKVLWAEMQKCNGTAGGAAAARRRSSQEQGQAQAQQDAGKGSKALKAALANLKAVVIDEVRKQTKTCCVVFFGAHAQMNDSLTLPFTFQQINHRGRSTGASPRSAPTPR